MREVTPKIDEFGKYGRFSVDFEKDFSELPREFTIRCSVKSKIFISPLYSHVISRHKKIKILIDGKCFTIL